MRFCNNVVHITTQMKVLLKLQNNVRLALECPNMEPKGILDAFVISSSVVEVVSTNIVKEEILSSAFADVEAKTLEEHSFEDIPSAYLKIRDEIRRCLAC